MRKIPATLLAYEPQAIRSQLAYIIAPGYDLPSGEKAGNKLRDLVWDKKLTANFVYEDNRYRYVVLTDKAGDSKASVNYKLVAAGLAKVDTGVDIPSALDKVLKDEEENAKNQPIGIWVTNELEEDEDD